MEAAVGSNRRTGSQEAQTSSGLRLLPPEQRWSLVTLIIILVCLLSTTNAAFVEFENCLSQSVQASNPQLLQFTPLNVSAFFNTTSTTNPLNITVYGNVSGLTTLQAYPPPDDPQWSNPNDTLGKIVDLSPTNNKYSTLFTKLSVLSYTPYQADPARFCNSTIHQACPLAPAFYVNATDLTQLPAFSVSPNLYSTYAFTSITASLRVQTGDASGQILACINASITPDLGDYLKTVLTYLPLVVLLIVGVATISAAILSPWGSSDPFRWTSNYGRDEDLLRLVTPGFGDCLQYIQFIVLTGSLSLNFPGFYQPVVSCVGWSSLMFNESFVTKGKGTISVVDGLYQYRTNSSYGLDIMSQLIGMTSVTDVWADMMVWLVVITVAVPVLTQIGFAARFLHRRVLHVSAEDLRSKNLPFTVGNVVRMTLSYFLLPLVSLSMFQLLIAGQGPAYSVALSVIVLVAIILFAVRLLLLFVRTRPRSFLFDDLPTVLAYGPLYNTYCDDAATFALVPIFLNVLRGIAIGAVQQSGIAQLVLLAICEIMLILTLNAFRPFAPATSMNIYHTFFACIRLVALLLSIAFVPSLGVSDSSRGWIGYAILLIHAAILVFGFFLNAIQTLIEVIARLAGAGGQGESGGGAARGGLSKVFGMRQLSRRVPRGDQPTRASTASNANMLAVEGEQKPLQLENPRSRSISASSTMLLNRDERPSQNFSSPTRFPDGQTSPETSSTYSRQLSTKRMSLGTLAGGLVGVGATEAKDPYYRPPRRSTMDPLTPSETKPRALFARGDWPKKAASASEDAVASEEDAGEGASTTPARDLAGPDVTDSRDYFDEQENELKKTKTDYAVREVDFYYGVRGPALSSGTRKLKTGPADPTGPVSSATGWFKTLLGNKTKEKGKGFEVVRSSRAPPPGMMAPTLGEGAQIPGEPYQDDPDKPDDGREPTAETARGVELDGTPAASSGSGYEPFRKAQASAPSLPLIDTGGDIELPSRIGSQSSKMSNYPGQAPSLPRRSSRRASSQDKVPDLSMFPSERLATVAASPPASPERIRNQDQTLTPPASGRIPFSGTNTYSSPARRKRYSASAKSYASSVGHEDDENQVQEPHMHHARHSSSALGAHAADLHEDRPSSVGFVQHHRASDNIHYSPDSPEFAGSTAEFLEQPARRV